MKILTYGDGYPKIKICGRCNSELEYNFEDIFSWTDTLDELVTTGIITCPVCGNSIVVFQYSRPRYDIKPKKRWWQR